MLRDEAVEVISRALGGRPGKRDHIIAALQQAQEHLEAHPTFYPWFLETENSAGSTVAGEERVVLPADFLAEKEEDSLWLLNPETPLTKRSLEVMRRMYPLPDTDLPANYAISGGYIRLRPVPNAIYSLRMIYYGRDRKLVANEENKWLRHASSWLIGIAGLQCANEAGHKGAIGNFTSMRDAARREVYVDSEARLHNNQTYLLGA